MRGQDKILPEHRSKKAYVYVRQSSMKQVLEHQESGRRQRELAVWVQKMGWPPSAIVVLDSDQAKTGQSSRQREDYKQLVGDVCLGEVGLVVGLYLSRLSRNNADWFPLIEMCGLTRTLIADEEGIYDPNDPNDRLLLGLKGTISEAEVQRIYSQLHGARWSKARRGELRRRIPTGYTYDEGDRFVMDPDERVRHALRSFFERFEQVGSACGVTRSYNREGLLFPTRWYRGKWDGPLRWHALSVRTATMILHNPVYAGVYFYGERRSETRLDPETKTRKTVVKHLPMEEWEVLIHDAHPVYISWEQFMRNQEKLKDNCSRRGGAGPVRSGATLLQGIVCCGRCGRRMAVQYQGRKSYPMYRCARHTKTGESEYCCSIPAEGVDRWVEQQLLEAMRPMGIEAALGAVEELEKRSSALRQEWENRIEQAEYEATLARRRYEGVDPDNRLVAANLERDWEDKLQEVEKVQKDFAERGAKPPIWISHEDREKVRALSKDIPRLWRLKSTKQSDRKKVVRILIRDVWLNLEDEQRQIKIWIHWQTGATTQGIIARPSPGHRTTGTSADVVERIRELYAQSKSDEQIAEHLNREGLRTGRDNSFNAKRVHYVVRKSGIDKTESKNRENQSVLALGAFSLIGCAAPQSTRTEPAERPNVLFISVDDLNDWITPLGGHPQARTPNLERLAREGVTFTRNYTASPGCNPSRTALLTGLHTYSTGMYSNYQYWREVLPDAETLPGYFMEHGYWTGGAGKIFHNDQPHPPSWNEYFPSKEDHMPDYFRPTPGETVNMPRFDNMYGDFDWSPIDIPEEETGDYRSVRWVIEQLQKEHERPFFLAAGIYRPHLPWYVPRKYFDLFPLESIEIPKTLEGDLDDVGERGREIAYRGGNYHSHVVEADQWKQAVQGYLASIAYADALVGLLLEALERSPYRDNTIVVLWSDHGWQLGEKEHWRKFALWDNVARTVLMMKVPGGTPSLPQGSKAGSRVERVTSLVDLFPTLVALAGLPEKDGLDGNSLVPLLADPTATWDHPEITTYDVFEFSIRTEDWRYIRYIDDSEELYDHRNDPEEWTNLADDPEYAEVKARLAGYIPRNPAPLVETSYQVMPHHVRPFRSKEDYVASRQD